MDKLTLEHLAPYFPYRLKGVKDGEKIEAVLLGIYGTGGHSLTLCERINNHNTVDYDCQIDDFKPLLRPLSDLTKEITHNGEIFVPIRELFQMAYLSVYGNRFEGNFYSSYDLDRFISLKADEDVLGNLWEYGFSVELPNWFQFSANGNFLTIPNFTIYQKLFEWHFDVFGLIEKGLAIDLNTIK